MANKPIVLGAKPVDRSTPEHTKVFPKLEEMKQRLFMMAHRLAFEHSVCGSPSYNLVLALSDRVP